MIIRVIVYACKFMKFVPSYMKQFAKYLDYVFYQDKIRTLAFIIHYRYTMAQSYRILSKRLHNRLV